MKRAASNLAVWLAIVAAVAILYYVGTSDRAAVGRAMNAPGDPRPGAKVRPTPEQMEQARRSAMRRRAD